jgi:hypothetical protein
LFFGTDFGLPLRLLPEWAFNKGKGWSCDLAFPTLEMNQQIADIKARHLTGTAFIKKRKIVKGSGKGDLLPNTDFNPKVQPKLPSKMTPAERQEIIDRVSPTTKGKSKSKNALPSGLTPFEILKMFSKTGANKKTRIQATKTKHKPKKN